MAIDFDHPGHQVLSPVKLAHIVLRTAQYKPMVDFYKTFLGAKATHENDMLSFLTYDEEHHRIAIVAVPGTSAKDRTSSGLEHTAFTFATLEDLCLAYRQRKAKGILPFWCINHGPTTSMYYQDPDGNQIETQVENFDDIEASNAFMASKSFAENPIGVDFDPEDLIRELQNGTDQALLKKRKDAGPRGIESVPVPPIPQPISV